jgi:hypothetical protein
MKLDKKNQLLLATIALFAYAVVLSSVLGSTVKAAIFQPGVTCPVITGPPNDYKHFYLDGKTPTQFTGYAKWGWTLAFCKLNFSPTDLKWYINNKYIGSGSAVNYVIKDCNRVGPYYEVRLDAIHASAHLWVGGSTVAAYKNTCIIT